MKNKILFLAAFFLAQTASAQYQVRLNSTTFDIPVIALDATTLAAKTNVSSWTCYRRLQSGTPAPCTGTLSENSDANQPGMWTYTPDATETANAGSVVYLFTATGTAPFRKEIQVGGVALVDNAIKPASYLPRGTAQSVSTTGIVLAASESFADSDLADTCVYIVSASTGAGQTRKILSYVGSTDTATVAAWGTLPTGTIVYDLFPCVGSSSSTPAMW